MEGLLKSVRNSELNDFFDSFTTEQKREVFISWILSLVSPELVITSHHSQASSHYFLTFYSEITTEAEAVKKNCSGRSQGPFISSLPYVNISYNYSKIWRPETATASPQSLPRFCHFYMYLCAYVGLCNLVESCNHYHNQDTEHSITRSPPTIPSQPHTSRPSHS